MVECTQVKKSSTAHRHGTAEEISERWIDNDEEVNNFLIVRLRFDGGSPWLGVHHGIYEVVKAPLFLAATARRSEETKQSIDNTVQVILRDFANRGNNCIKRKFYFKFPSSADALSFIDAHNNYLEEHHRNRHHRLLNEKMKVEDKIEMQTKEMEALSREVQRKYRNLKRKMETSPPTPQVSPPKKKQAREIKVEVKHIDKEAKVRKKVQSNGIEKKEEDEKKNKN